MAIKNLSSTLTVTADASTLGLVSVKSHPLGYVMTKIFIAIAAGSVIKCFYRDDDSQVPDNR